VNSAEPSPAILTFAIGATASDSKIALNKNQAVGSKPKLE